jgi:hypothetical protein
MEETAATSEFQNVLQTVCTVLFAIHSLYWSLTVDTAVITWTLSVSFAFVALNM